MGMKPYIDTKKKRTPLLVVDERVQDLLDIHADALRELLERFEIPPASWENIWTDLETDDLFAKADTDLDLQWIVGWIRGVADVLGTTEASLVRL